MMPRGVILKQSDFVLKDIGFVGRLDISVRQYQDQPKILYIGQGSQVIQIPLENLDEFIEFIKEGINLPFVDETIGWLK